MIKLKIIIYAILIGQLTAQQCGQGCQTCSTGQMPICIYCEQGYQLNNGVCIYQGCSPSLYLQINEKDEDSSVESCSSICNPLFNADEQTNTCKKLVQCSSIHSTQPNFFNPGIPTDFFIYQQSYYVTFQQGYLSIYDRVSLGLIKNLSYDQDDLTILSVKSQIFVMKKDFSINVWDIKNESRYVIDQHNIILISLQTEFISFLDTYLMVYEIQQQSTLIQIIYDFVSSNQIISNPIQINQPFQFHQVINNYLFLGDQTNLIVYQINFQEEKVNLNFTQLMTFSFLNKRNMLSIIPSTNSNIYFLIFTNSISIIDISEQTYSSLISLTSIKKVKFIQLDNTSNSQHLVILNQQNLIDYNIISKEQNIILSEVQVITDFDIGNFSGNNNQLLILSNQSTLELYNIDDNIYEQIQKITLKFQSKSLKKIPISYNTQQQEYIANFEIAFFSSTSIQIIRESSIQKQFLETTIIENYNLPFPTPTSQVNSLTYVYSPQILISCHQNGDIIFYDASRQSNINLIQKLSFDNQECTQLQRFSDNKIAALVGQNLLLIDPSQQIIINQLVNLVSIVQITSNQDKLAINYNNCVQIISSEFVSLFFECQTDFSSNNLNIALNYDLKIYLQKQNQISVYQIDLQKNNTQLLYSISTTYPIQHFSTVSIFETDQDTILNSYFIDEIIYFDTQSNFNTCTTTLQITYTIQVSLINELISVKRVINDASVYFLAGYQPSQGMYRIFLVSKSLASYIQFSTIPYLPVIDYPKKIVNGYGTVLYTINRSIILSFFTLFKDYQIDINKNITYITGHEYLNNDKQSASQNNMIGPPLNFMSYIGTNSGLIYTAKIQKDRYIEIPTFQVLSISQVNDQILEIIQSAHLGITQTIYQIDYTLSGFEYESQLNEPNNFQTSIPINNNTLEFLFFNSDNIMFRYQKFNINFENIIDGSQIVDCIGEVIHFTQIQPSLIVTLNIFSKDYNKIFVGLSNGQVLLYNFKDLSQQYFMFQNNNQIINTSVISIIFDESQQNEILYFASSGGMLQIIDLSNKKPTQQINLISLVNEDPQIILKEFIIDFTYSRYLGSIYFPESNILKLYGLHQLGVFENNLSISLYDNDEQFDCSNIISDSDISQLNRKISNISPKQNMIYTTLGSSTTQSSGGALYFENIGSTQLYFDGQTKVIQNQALIGGGLRIFQTKPGKSILPSGFPFENNIKQNYADIFGDNCATYLQKAIIQNFNPQDSKNNYLFTFHLDDSNVTSNYKKNYISQIDIDQFQSGGQLSLKIFLVDSFNRYLSFSLQKLLSDQYPEDISNELKSIQITINNLNTKQTQLIGERILNYNQYDSDSQSFTLTGLEIQGVLSSLEYFSIESSIQANSQIQQPILLSISFRECELCEIIEEQNNQIMSCRICQEGKYSLVDPNFLFKQSQIAQSKIQNQCNNCPNSAIECQGSFISLKNGYWRQNNQTDEIVDCDPQIGSCQAENPSSINYCTEGYIGPICQQCDNIGEIWNGIRYQQSTKRGYCQKCYQESIVTYFLFTTFVFISQFKYTQTCYYLRKMKLLPISKSSINDYSGFYIKIIINYYQLSSLLIPQPQILPVNFNILNEVLGQTSRQLSLGIECMVSVDKIKNQSKRSNDQMNVKQSTLMVIIMESQRQTTHNINITASKLNSLQGTLQTDMNENGYSEILKLTNKKVHPFFRNPDNQFSFQKHYHSNFKQLSYSYNTDESNINIKTDFIVEENKNKTDEELQIKNLKNYNFYAKSSEINSK
ncbi:hypothetical protein TTHERM_002653365 (macronuclear) [Tetrahymena thermophila SB210]|uniref:Transmembrane protein n=1 Tax=Tetrahymena thermophila (strain SB210) TaxID=312017 RepID=W7X489_TETTS|nr:hypothetical protein TTHERM_002653365 [Tetrahymena thermophila SB210]EWS74130.1 hypothetical protein TTHERM_002653365 [Tetrahymena thermophila SB210]|eukprot:XP_012653335.1 hypothetical protein TTHERM_002653365 [Tetrahymena thermophila SB210]